MLIFISELVKVSKKCLIRLLPQVAFEASLAAGGDYGPAGDTDRCESFTAR